MLSACSTKTEDPSDPSPPKTALEEQATFQIEKGLEIQLVAEEPMVQDPVVISFDEDGRLWVVEMRGFMPDIDGNGEDQRVGRISILEDTNGDGKMDESTIYLDSIVLPRALAIIRGGALVAENGQLWLTLDTDGDFRADTKTLIDSQYASELVEHSGNGLWRGVDNWYYNAKSRLRYKLVDGTWKRDSTEFRGQWGISHDDKGRLYYNYNWSQLHADLVPPNYLSRNKNHTPTTGIDHGLTIDRRVYPVRPNPAVNRGYIPGTLDEKGRLLEFTAACSPLYYRGTSLPGEYYGNAFVCEPSGNLIKRNVVEEEGTLLRARDPHPGVEFLASTDERFRPVFLTSGPDGALYVADMYRGLVQHGKYVTPYLREQTLTRNLVKPINRGRIWRIVPSGWKPPAVAKLSKASNEELVAELSHPDGWHRDMAQRLLIEKGDRGLQQLLTEVALRGTDQRGRFHALWTLEGLNLLTPELLVGVLSDSNPLIANTATRLIEPLCRNDKKLLAKFGSLLAEQVGTAPIERVLQITLSADALDPILRYPILSRILDRYDTSALIRDAVMSSLENREYALLRTLWNLPSWQKQRAGKEIFLEMLAAAIARHKNPTELLGLQALIGKGQPTGWRERAVITSLTIHGSIPSRNTTQQKTKLTADELQLFVKGRQYYLTTCAGCHGNDGAGLPRLAPTLVGSEWVTGDERRLALIVLHGIEGPLEVAGKKYDEPEILPVMPAHSTLDDGSITAVLTYIRNEWGNNAGPMNRRTVGQTRHTTQGRVMPWTAGELNKHIEGLNKDSESK